MIISFCCMSQPKNNVPYSKWYVVSFITLYDFMNNFVQCHVLHNELFHLSVCQIGVLVRPYHHKIMSDSQSCKKFAEKFLSLDIVEADHWPSKLSQQICFKLL